MKKVLAAAAAVAAMAACTKSNVVYEEGTELNLFPVNYSVTKANGAISGTTYPADEAFGVFAQHTTSVANTNFADDAGTMNAYLTDVKFIKKGEDNTWGGETTYYWPKTGSLYFAGYSPFRAAGTKAYDFTKDAAKLTITDFVQGTYNFDNTQNQMVDLMWFDVTATSANTGAPAVTFKHALSYLTFNFTSDTDIFTLKSVTLKDVVNKGTFTSGTAPVWNNSEDKVNIAHTADQAMTATAYTVDNILVIPQDAVKLEIVFDQKSGDGETAITHTQTLDLTGGDGAEQDTGKWLLGKHYVYNVKFTAEEILLTPSVEDWTTVNSDITVE